MVRGIHHWFTAAGRGALLLMVPAVLAVLIPLPAPAQTASEGPFRLIGIIAGSEFTGAVLDDSTGNQTFYHLRESLPDGSQIVAAADDHVSVKRSDGTSYRLFISHDAKPSPQTARPPVAVAPAVMPAPAAPSTTLLPQAEKENQWRYRRASPGGAGGGQQAAVQGTGPNKTGKQAAGSRRHSGSDTDQE
ncbi:MAG TPA: hypothetical protein VL197_08770 [Nitrospirota bacterium]|nr:hypothetical protein [Nitrospirota bacterium]